MPDLYLTIAEQPDAVFDAIAASMTTRANEPEMREICRSYMENSQAIRRLFSKSAAAMAPPRA